MDSFIYDASPARIVFGSGTVRRLGGEVERLGLSRVLILSTPQQRELAASLAADLGALAIGTHAEATMHTPVDVTERAVERVRALAADGLVAVGGGSTTGLGKAIALRTDLPQIVVPTTYAGSEVTAILGETADGLKRTISDPRVLPEVVLYDVDLTRGLPKHMSAVSGLNAIAHGVEALYARNRNPVTSLMAVEGIAALVRALPVIVSDADPAAARHDALYGAWLCGTCLGTVGMALHHKLCHTLGGAFDLPHAETHAVLLPHALAYNAAAVPEAMARLAGVLGPDPARALYDLGRTLGIPGGLRDIGMPEEGIDRATDLALASPYWNPRLLTRDGIRDVIERAWAGAVPHSTR